MSVVKRDRDDEGSSALAKRSKVDEEEGPVRTSGLKAPIMALTGHEAGVMSLRFDPTGKYLATGSLDKQLFLWHVYGNCENTHVFKGHKGAILQVDWSRDGALVASASADKTLLVWDVETGRRVRKYTEHTSHVNSVCCAREDSHLMATASDDCSTKMWDTRVRRCLQTITAKYQQTACALSADDNLLFTGGIDNVIRVWDRRKTEISFTLEGHSETLTSLRLSPNGSYLMSNAMDSSLRIWDVRPYAPTDRCIKIFTGAVHNFEKNLLRCNWSPDGGRITTGSADRFVYVWDTTTRQILYKLPGHVGSVNEVDFHPTEPIVGSCSSDRKVFLGEIAKAT